MTIHQFEQLIGRRLVVQRRAGLKAWRCFFERVVFADKFGSCGVVTTVVGAGPNQERMRADFAQKISGKIARVYDGLGAYTEHPVPRSLSA